jgi:hypothetical protein
LLTWTEIALVRFLAGIWKLKGLNNQEDCRLGFQSKSNFDKPLHPK